MKTNRAGLERITQAHSKKLARRSCPVPSRSPELEDLIREIERAQYELERISRELERLSAECEAEEAAEPVEGTPDQS